MDYIGGNTQDGRNNYMKLSGLRTAKLNSYQAEWITFNGKKQRCLINPDKQTDDFDKKEISIEFDAGMKDGDIFLWDRTDTYWMTTHQYLEEEAYYRAQIVQCDYQLNGWWIYLRGPVETKLVWRQKHQLEMNEPNYSLLVWIAKNEETDAFFKRFQIIKFDGHRWRVGAVDRYSQQGIIEVYLEEYFDNELEEEMIVPEVIEPDKTTPHIDGPQIVKPYDEQLIFTPIGLTNGKLVANSNKVKINEMKNGSYSIDILTGRSMSFKLSYVIDGEDTPAAELDIRVESF